MTKEGKLKWSDLKIGDVIQRDCVKCMVTGINYDRCKVYVFNFWLDDIGLKHWKKVEEIKENENI